MYIWILLATIMVTFAFYNVAPRADKEHALNEIKAATIVNRFKAEHSARLHTMECEILYNQNTPDKNKEIGWNGATSFEEGGGLVSASLSSQGPVNVTTYDPSIGYGMEENAMFEQNLPVGYYRDEDSSNGNYKGGRTIHHFIYCLKDFIYKPAKNDEGIEIPTQGFTDCHAEDVDDIGRKRYFVSYMQLPDRWVSKDGTYTPLPMLINLLAKASDRSASFGWVEYVCPKGTADCAGGNNGKFLLHGLGNSSSVAMKYSEVSDETKKFEIKETYEDDEGNTKERVKNSSVVDERQELEDNASKDEEGNNKYNYVRYVNRDVAIPAESPLWNNDSIKNNCKARPCILVYEVMPIMDAACHCYNILHKNNPLSVARCFNEAYSAKKSQNEKTVIGEKEYKKTYTHGGAGDGGLKGNVFTKESYKDDAEKWECMRCKLLPKPADCNCNKTNNSD